MLFVIQIDDNYFDFFFTFFLLLGRTPNNHTGSLKSRRRPWLTPHGQTKF
jgi:hypothetical protein